MATTGTRHSVLGFVGIIALSMTAPVALGDDPCDVSAPPPEPRPLRLIRILGKHCPSDSIARPIVMPDLFEAKLFDSASLDRRDNAFGINDAGVVVGSFGKRLNPCEVLDPLDPTEPRAFVRLPRSSASMGLGGTLAGLLAYDIHQAAGLAAAPLGSAIHRSTANGVSESSRYVVGQVGTAFETDGVAWMWDLQGATGSAIVSQDLTDDLAGPLAPTLPSLWRSEAHAVMHATGESAITIAGGVDSICIGQSLFWGFRLELGDPLGAVYLLPEQRSAATKGPLKP